MRLNLIIWEKQNNLKAKEVAEKLGVSETTYSLIRNGKTMPSIDFAYKFREVFKYDGDVLELLRKEEN